MRKKSLKAVPATDLREATQAHQQPRTIGDLLLAPFAMPGIPHLLKELMEAACNQGCRTTALTQLTLPLLACE